MSAVNGAGEVSAAQRYCTTRETLLTGTPPVVADVATFTGYNTIFHLF
ncbi:MAG: hypothetical protein GY822_17375 [Deltaproteobacteria bacterium]|nr:hypothetical protein [Deltaproteobacteria bacterium]